MGLRKGETRKQVRARLKEFRALGKKGNPALFRELCFCILTANFHAERSIRIQRAVGDGFLTLSEKRLAGKLKTLGHRYPNARAGYIVEARTHMGELAEIAKSRNSSESRTWLVENVKGIGYKEASHFLRNTGHRDLAIIDFHIIDLLAEYGLIGGKPKGVIARKRYLQIENLLKKVAAKLNISLAELDMYLWYAETGKVLK